MTLRLMRTGAAPMTGPLKASDGSVGSPSLTFNTSPSTGFYKTANGIGVSVDGTKVAEFTSAGGGRYLGELIPYTRLTALAYTVLPYGQTLSRTTYADLWAIAQDEIAAGNTFYNNGDGTTTFGIGDLRGRVLAGKDDMGGSAAGRLTSTYFGTSAAVLGAAGGSEYNILVENQLPVHSHANSLNDPGHRHIIPIATFATAFASKAAADGLFVTGGSNGFSEFNFTGMTITNASTGAGWAHNNTQPTFVCNYLLYAGA